MDDIFDIPHKVIAKHNGKLLESMRQTKKRWKEEKKGIWPYYVKAYFYDKMNRGDENVKQ